MNPYSDGLMVYDEVAERYVLTEDALRRRGIFLREKIEASGGAFASEILNGILDRTSEILYDFIYKHNANNERQKHYMKTLPSFRNLIYSAMLNQVTYMIANGDLTLSPDPQMRDRAISPAATVALERTLPEIRKSILYSGGF